MIACPRCRARFVFPRPEGSGRGVHVHGTPATHRQALVIDQDAYIWIEDVDPDVTIFDLLGHPPEGRNWWEQKAAA